MQNYIPQGNVVNNQSVPPQQVPPQQAYCPAGTPPSCSAVNIQILNPTAGSPNGYFYPQQTASAYDAGTQGGCYNPYYYTAGSYNNPYANGGYSPYPPNGGGYTTVTQQPTAPKSGSLAGNNSSNDVDKKTGEVKEEQNGASTVSGQNSDSKNTETQNDKTASTSATTAEASNNNVKPSATDAQDGKTTTAGEEKGGTTSSDAQNSANSTGEKNAGNSSNSSNSTNNENSSKESKDSETVQSNKHKEKRDVVELTDNYIKTLENYLNSQDVEVRKMGAREVVNRLEEDPSRKDDPALTALVNKMLQDPSVAIRAIALSIVESQTLHGNDLTASILQKMQTSKDGFGQDAIQASSALLKMAGKTVEKEVEVPNKKSAPKSEEKKSDDKKADKK